MITESDIKRITAMKNVSEVIGYKFNRTFKFIGKHMVSKIGLIFVGIGVIVVSLFVGMSGKEK